MTLRIEDYALIGDLETAALVGRDGSIDWLCWPRFDSDACFAALLGDENNGRWLVAPDDMTGVHVSRRYREDSMILETRFESDSAAVTLVDFMPPRGANSDIVRLVRGERGEMAMRMELVLRFGYGDEVPWVTRLDDGDGTALRAVVGPHRVVLRTPVEVRGVDLRSRAAFAVSAGETIPFVLTYSTSHLPMPDPIDPAQALADSEDYWREWVEPIRARTGDGHGANGWTDALIRSLVTLKALTYAPTGGIVAAPTTSLPEWIGGTRNWDYRFCWLRDATLTLLGFMNGGYYEEAEAWRDWLLRAVAGSADQMQIMYSITGERRLTEWEVDWLSGYEQSRPVRIGNAAHGQLQLDVYGEITDALHQARLGGIPENAAAWDLQIKLLDHLETIWDQPDEGIWEVRGGRRHFTYSKIMAWVAFDRGIKSAEQFGYDGPVARWRQLREVIHADVLAKGFDKEMNSFVQSYGSKQLDAALLLVPAVGFLPPDDPRFVGTVAAIEKHLLRDGFVLRYDTEKSDADSLPAGEGAFLACSFWLADAYLMLGRGKDAEKLFERLLALRNDVGLLSEEYEPGAGRLIGNFPQAFSHLALIGTAHNLRHEDKPMEQRSGHSAAEKTPAG
ncbi:MAG TPA: glycoside hydrolase family 15 protein [Candidatus Limnocylindria bacterium]|nr:glycoside hydrolase family 15 protein [Candidatus Limnocylindria bacterium]